MIVASVPASIQGVVLNTNTFYTFDERGNVCQRVLPASSGSPGPQTNGVQTGRPIGGKAPPPLISEVYDAYGARTGTAAQADPFGYEGQAGYYTDTETGLILCTHRFYDPGNGRWLTRDPLGYAGGVNLYGYVGNDPANGVDPTGLATMVMPGALTGTGVLILRGLGTAIVEFVAPILVAPIVVAAAPIAGIVAVGSAGVWGGNRLGNEIADTIEAQDGLPAPGSIYRRGGTNPGNWKPSPGGRSCRDSLSNPWPMGTEGPVFRPGDPWVSLDPARLPPGSVVWDNDPPGHVSVDNDVPIGEPGEIGTIKGGQNGRGVFPK